MAVTDGLTSGASDVTALGAETYLPSFPYLGIPRGGLRRRLSGRPARPPVPTGPGHPGPSARPRPGQGDPETDRIVFAA